MEQQALLNAVRMVKQGYAEKHKDKKRIKGITSVHISGRFDAKIVAPFTCKSHYK